MNSLRHGLIETDQELDLVQRLQKRNSSRPSLTEISSRRERSFDDMQDHSFRSREVEEGVHESSAFSASELKTSRNFADGELSDAVQAALDSASRMRSDHRSDHSGRVPREQDNYFSYNRHRTPPRSKRPAVSIISKQSPVLVSDVRRSASKGHRGDHSDTFSYGHSSTSPMVGYGAIRSVSAVEPRSHSALRSSATSSQRKEVESSANTNQSFRRKVKATVRRNA